MKSSILTLFMLILNHLNGIYQDCYDKELFEEMNSNILGKNIIDQIKSSKIINEDETGKIYLFQGKFNKRYAFKEISPSNENKKQSLDKRISNLVKFSNHLSPLNFHGCFYFNNSVYILFGKSTEGSKEKEMYYQEKS